MSVSSWWTFSPRFRRSASERTQQVQQLLQRPVQGGTELQAAPAHDRSHAPRADLREQDLVQGRQVAPHSFRRDCRHGHDAHADEGERRGVSPRPDDDGLHHAPR